MTDGTRYHVLLIGLDAYPDQPLSGCVSDIECFERLLLERVGVPATAITKLTSAAGPAPTKQVIVNALRALAREVEHPGAHVLIYYAGHGTQLYLPGALSNHEALVPLDAAGDASKLLYDFELSPLLHAIAERSQDCTVILDCCCAAGTFRDVLRPDSGIEVVGTRFYHCTADQQALAPLTALPTERGLTQATQRKPRQLSILSAAQADEKASEIAVLGPPRSVHGALSYCLLRLLHQTPPEALSTLAWSALWDPLLVAMQALNVPQQPSLSGSRSRFLFGGAGDAADPGLTIRASKDGVFEIDGGELAGLTVQAEVAVYDASQPPQFSPLGSAADLAQRRGHLTVERVEGGHAYAVSRDLAATALPAGARGRLTQLGIPQRLRIQCEPNTAAWVRDLLTEQARMHDFTLVAADGPRAEVYIGQELDERGLGTLYLGDEIYPADATKSPGPLGRIEAPRSLDEPEQRATMAEGLRCGLHHYLQYVQPLRLQQKAERPDSLLHPNDLRVSLYNITGTPADSDDPTAIAAVIQNLRSLRRIAPSDSGRYLLANGDRIWIRVHHGGRLLCPLFVTAVLCDSAGAVYVLNDPVKLLPSTGDFLWPLNGPIGQPFVLTLAERSVAIDRLIVVSSTEALSLQFLSLPTSLQADIDEQLGGGRGTEIERPRLEWTATRLLLETR